VKTLETSFFTDQTFSPSNPVTPVTFNGDTEDFDPMAKQNTKTTRRKRPEKIALFLKDKGLPLAWPLLSDPMDDAERSRNDRVFELQGNRNPFIDRSD